MVQYTSNLTGTRLSTIAVVQFRTSDTAGGLVAGLPAAARAIREVALAGLGECWLKLGSGGPLLPQARQEVLRLAGAMRVHGLDQRAGKEWPAIAAAEPAPPLPSERLLLITGEALVEAVAIRAALATGESRDPALRFTEPGDAAARSAMPPDDADIILARYAATGRAIVRATAKSTDGLVSRSLNRPISQAISRVALKSPGVRPIHATMGTAVLAVVMFAVLLLGTPAGLVCGAILFQAASVIDGVDGEIARATYRTSDRGAMIDTLIDAATNLGFVAGLVINLAERGRWVPAMFGIAGLTMLALGLTVLGRHARRRGAPINFDALKGRFRENGSLWGKWVVWLTMRDFLALASVVLVIAGLTDQAIAAFSGIMAVWLVVVLTTLARQSALSGRAKA